MSLDRGRHVHHRRQHHRQGHGRTPRPWPSPNSSQSGPDFGRHPPLLRIGALGLHRRVHPPGGHCLLHDGLGHQHWCRSGRHHDGNQGREQPRFDLPGHHQHTQGTPNHQSRCSHGSQRPLWSLLYPLVLQLHGQQISQPQKDVVLHFHPAHGLYYHPLHPCQLAREPRHHRPQEGQVQDSRPCAQW